MGPSQDTQLEKILDEALQSGDVEALDVFLQWEVQKGSSIKCSQQFLTKLDELVSRSLDQKDSKSALSGLAILCKCGPHLKLPRDLQGLSGLVTQGLPKMWFEKCKQLWIHCGPKWDETLFNLSEDFFDAIIMVHDSCKEGTYKITEFFLYPVGQLAVDPRIYIMIQKEAIRKFNLILDKVPVELNKKMKILASQEASDIMIKLAGQIMESGDYDLQTAQMEALCRMATPQQRKEMADRWFSMEHVARAFVQICDSEFETDCRKFLNLVNGMQGDRRRVYSYPCLEVYLDKYELLMPSDEKLEEFWIDFNLSSRNISFYFSLADEETEESQWETICITENEVQSYTVTEKGKRKILQLKLSVVVVVGSKEGSSLTIHFSSALDILQAARNVYGHNKNRGFVGKTSTSVVKTTVKIQMEENSSQVVPESQLSIGDSGKNTVPYPLPAQSVPVQMVTPVKISESITFTRSTVGGGASSISSVMPSTLAKVKGKPSLEMVCSSKLRTTAKTADRSHGTTPNSTLAGGRVEQSLTSKQVNTNKNTAKAAQQEEEQCLDHTFVPDTQPQSGRNTCSSSNWSKLSVSEILMMPTQKVNPLPRTGPCSSLTQQQVQRHTAQRLSVPVVGPVSQKQLHTELTQRLQQVLTERNQVSQELRQKETSNIREESKNKSSGDQFASAFCAPKEQKAKRNSLAKQKSKGQMSQEVEVAAPAKGSATKAPQKRISPSCKAQANQDMSSKEKRDAEVAGSMVKHISSHYKSTGQDTTRNAPRSRKPPFANKLIFNMSWLSTTKSDVSGAESLMRPNSKTVTSFTRQRKDIFTFTPEAPLSAAGKDKAFINTSAISSGDTSIRDSSVHPSTTKKELPVPKEKRNVKKHLFSDTDPDQSMTPGQISWLRDSSRKPKPSVITYPKQAAIKPKVVPPHASSESPDLPPSSPKPVKRNNVKVKNRPDVKKKAEQPKKTAQPAARPNRPHAAARRPRRAAATSTKSYRELNTDTSQSESESETPCFTKNVERARDVAQTTKNKAANKQPAKDCMKPESINRSNQSERQSEHPSSSKTYFVGQQGKNEKTFSEGPEVKKRKSTSSEQSTNIYRRWNSTNQPDLKKPSHQQKPENVAPEIVKANKRIVSSVQDKTNALKDSWAARQTSFCSSPPFIEKMRSAGRSNPTLALTCSPLLSPRGFPLPASPDPLCHDTPSPIPLLPKPRSTVSSKGNLKHSSFYNAEKKHNSSKTLSIQSVPSLPSLTPKGQTPAGASEAELSSVDQRRASPRSSPLLSLPLLTSTLLELDKPSMPSLPQSPFPEDTVNHDCQYGFSKVSSVSQVSLSLSSTQSSVLIAKSPSAVQAVKRERSPPSLRDLNPGHLHISGPSRKRHISLSSNFEEDEELQRKKSKLRRQHSPRMKPRKLFNSFADVSAEREATPVMSSSHTVASSHWEADVDEGDIDMEEDLELPGIHTNSSSLCQEFSSDLKKKFESRSKMMEVYNKQSLKAVQQHVSSFNTQVSKYRTQWLQQVEEVILAEICKLEHDETVLKSIEKDLTMYWKKQSVAFRSYKEQGKRSNETLSKALQSKVCHSLDFEEKLFTSQMRLIKTDMKSVQDRLLGQMQEVEVLSVKRGLHALFFP